MRKITQFQSKEAREDNHESRKEAAVSRSATLTNFVDHMLVPLSSMDIDDNDNEFI